MNKEARGKLIQEDALNVQNKGGLPMSAAHTPECNNLNDASANEICVCQAMTQRPEFEQKARELYIQWAKAQGVTEIAAYSTEEAVIDALVDRIALALEGAVLRAERETNELFPSTCQMGHELIGHGANDGDDLPSPCPLCTVDAINAALLAALEEIAFSSYQHVSYLEELNRRIAIANKAIRQAKGEGK